VIHGIDAVLIPKMGTTVTERGTSTAASGHRKLLQSGQGETALTFRQQGALQDTAGAIADAASGQSSAAAATAVGSTSSNYAVGLNDAY
jgi:hypothetical protein